MSAIDTMVIEHKNVKAMLKVMRGMSIKVLNNDKVDYSDFYKVIDFVRTYTDKHHHAKEENILFKKMGEELGERIARGPIAGMLVEHDLGRLYMANLEAALEKFSSGDMDARVDIIANSISYADLLTRHIEKEDTTIYKFAERALNKTAMEDIEDKCAEIENLASEKSFQKKYIDLLNELIEKYL
ncbi:hemerythrin domain-containing protein [Candidatus Clostridium stratigraminis]|uniref:Hemerythrin domain-containing protein n=1 Tax=Candidatus Clostridium stratigraminis TaxID=3381661 RepID=A0ABW8T5R0_9CLOT